jgi:hypothetical protein
MVSKTKKNLRKEGQRSKYIAVAYYVRIASVVRFTYYYNLKYVSDIFDVSETWA